MVQATHTSFCNSWNKLFVKWFNIFPAGPHSLWGERPHPCVFTSEFSQPLGWCLIHNRSSINICWMNSFHWSYRLADLLEENQEELATIEALDSGAVYTLALKTHIGMSVQTFRYFAGWCDKIQVRYKCYLSPWRSSQKEKGRTFSSSERHCFRVIY